MASEISTWRIMVQSTIWFGIVCALLFGGAGIIDWPEAWVCIFVQISSSVFMVLWMKKHNPALLKVRTDFWTLCTLK